MLNQAALEDLYSATLLEDYLDCVENLPDDIQRQLSKMMEIDVNYQALMKELEGNMSYLLEDEENQDTDMEMGEKGKKKAYSRLQQILIKTQELGDEKLQIGQQIQDLVDNKARQLDLDKKNMDFGKEQDSIETFRETKSSESSERLKRARRARHEVYVPSILGPSTLEATSYGEAPSEPHQSQHNASRVSFSSSHQPSTSSSSSAAASNVAAGSSGTAPSSSRNSSAHTLESSTSGLGSSHASTSGGGTTTVSATTNSSSTSAGGERGSGSRDSGAYAASTSTPKKSHKQAQDKKYKKRKSTNKQNDVSPPNIPIDPDEPLYCLCDQVSYGEMIGCDNDLCPIEWFHFSCVSLTTKPKGRWYCPKCRGDRPNIMKPKAIFLKELEKYNREKEEKA